MDMFVLRSLLPVFTATEWSPRDKFRAESPLARQRKKTCIEDVSKIAVRQLLKSMERLLRLINSYLGTILYPPMGIFQLN
jgi:hypothetical protein